MSSRPTSASSVAPCQRPRGPRPLKIIPAARPDHIKHFATKIEPRQQARGHRLSLDFGERHATARELGLFERARARHLDLQQAKAWQITAELRGGDIGREIEQNGQLVSQLDGVEHIRPG